MANLSIATLFLVVVLCFAGVSVAKQCPNVQPVTDLNVLKYLGLWYESSTTSTSDNTFERNCYCTRANYSLSTDGSYLVVDNTCNLGSVQGPQQAAIGKAVPDPENPAKLNVTFGPSPPAPYWVIILDPNYQYAVVWSCEAVLFTPVEFMWVLSRTPTMDASLYASITQQAQKITGYNVDTLIPTPQQGCTYQ